MEKVYVGSIIAELVVTLVLCLVMNCYRSISL